MNNQEFETPSSGLVETAYVIITPENFQKVPLPFFKEWYEDLKKEPKQAKGKLEFDGGHCCLGRLSIVQGRLKEGMDGENSFGLDKDNPCYSVFGGYGEFPQNCQVLKENTYATPAEDFAGLNDGLHLSMTEIADVLNALFCPVSE